MLNLRREHLPLKTTTGRLFTIDGSQLQPLKDELEVFLSGEQQLNSRLFSKRVMFTHELKANNTVEGINDSVSLIENVIKRASSITDEERRNRIINLYNGYKYILEGKEINEDTVRKLYSILSKDLLSIEDSSRMGEFYRTAPVYILNNGRLDDSMDHGIDSEDLSDYMKVFFDYVNNGEVMDSQTDYFIKSQILHFYFVYIHPYFDINGRTSRTIAMWYLLNNEIYPYIIFNRGIPFDASYDSIIRDCKDRYDLTKFLKYMLITVKKEFEKEYVMQRMSVLANRKWETMDYQTMQYFLSMNGERTILDFANMYRHFNEKKKIDEIIDGMLMPLIDDGTLSVVRETKKTMNNGEPNLVLSLNKKRLGEVDPSKVSRINL